MVQLKIILETRRKKSDGSYPIISEKMISNIELSNFYYWQNCCGSSYAHLLFNNLIAMKIIELFGRILFSLIFLTSAINHFSEQTIQYAASQGVPFASVMVPASGIIAIIGALSIIFGYKARAGALLIALFLVPVTLMMHQFWTISDPVMRQMQMAMFMKNTSMLGGALLIAYFGSGPLSLDYKT